MERLLASDVVVGAIMSFLTRADAITLRATCTDARAAISNRHLIERRLAGCGYPLLCDAVAARGWPLPSVAWEDTEPLRGANLARLNAVSLALTIEVDAAERDAYLRLRFT